MRTWNPVSCHICGQEWPLKQFEEHHAVCESLIKIEMARGPPNARVAAILELLEKYMAEHCFSRKIMSILYNIEQLARAYLDMKASLSPAFVVQRCMVYAQGMKVDSIASCPEEVERGYSGAVTFSQKMRSIMKEHVRSINQQQHNSGSSGGSSEWSHDGSIPESSSTGDSRSGIGPQAGDYGSVKITDFKILKPVSRGAYGRVYLAKKRDTGHYYAIKMIAFKGS
eukprot:evm.model.scf_2466.2 EVM.evm.TU.scf_2466.2   scf_2466:4605-6908(-)